MHLILEQEQFVSLAQLIPVVWRAASPALIVQRLFRVPKNNALSIECVYLVAKTPTHGIQDPDALVQPVRLVNGLWKVPNMHKSVQALLNATPARTPDWM